MHSSGRSWLVGAGVLSAIIAVLHAAIIVAEPRGYVYFAAGDLAPLAAVGSSMPALLTAGLALVPEVLGLLRDRASTPPRYAVFSPVALTAGLAYLVGAWRARSRLQAVRRASAVKHTVSQCAAADTRPYERSHTN